MRNLQIALGVAGIATLLWNGYVFSDWDNKSVFSIAMAVITTLAWLWMFVFAWPVQGEWD